MQQVNKLKYSSINCKAFQMVKAHQQILRTCIMIVTIILMIAQTSYAQEQISFQSLDGLEITADLYKSSHANSTVIILFHQARSSRGEYRNIAPRLVKMGYTTLAVDQRSGDQFNKIRNETAERAQQQNLAAEFTDALPDMRAAIQYARTTLDAEKILIWGSSYSASLSLVIAGQNLESIEGVFAFSPGEYFRGAPSVAKAAKTISVPTFITAAKSETRHWKNIFEALPKQNIKTGFVPSKSGKHGSSALFSPNAAEYWRAVETFLKTNF